MLNHTTQLQHRIHLDNKVTVVFLHGIEAQDNHHLTLLQVAEQKASEGEARV